MPPAPTRSGRSTPSRRPGFKDGRLASWLTVVDEATGALLDVELSPPEQWQEITAAEARELLRRVFCRWGLPERLRIDNGHPWGSAGDLPTELALWLVGLGVVPDWNPARQPWLNPKVERNNGVTQQWVEVDACPDHATLKDRLAWACRLQREEYPDRGGPNPAGNLPGTDPDPPPLRGRERADALGTEPRRCVPRRPNVAPPRRPLRHDLAVQPRSLLGQSPRGQGGPGEFDPKTRHWVVADATDGEPLVRSSPTN